MKKLASFSMVVSLVFGAPSLGLAQHEYQVGLKLGGAVPTGDFGEDFDSGFLYGIYGEVAYSPRFSFEGALVRHTHDQSDQGLGELFRMDILHSMFSGHSDLDFLSNEANVTINEFTINGRIYLVTSGAFRPYATLGTGVYFWDIDFDNIGDATETDFGVNGGGGVTFALTERISVGAEARYNYVWIQLGADDFSLEWWDFAGLVSAGF